MQQFRVYIAWRYFDDHKPYFVSDIALGTAGPERYSYTTEQRDALKLTARECLTFTERMTDLYVKSYYSNEVAGY